MGKSLHYWAFKTVIDFEDMLQVFCVHHVAHW